MIFLRGDETDQRRVEKLSRITDVLVERVGRLEETRGSAWSMFQAAVALEQEVQARTRDLERALADLHAAVGDLPDGRPAARTARASRRPVCRHRIAGAPA